MTWASTGIVYILWTTPAAGTAAGTSTANAAAEPTGSDLKLCLSAGAIVAKETPAGGDMKLYMTADGSFTAKTTQPAGSRQLAELNGAWAAGAAA